MNRRWIIKPNTPPFILSDYLSPQIPATQAAAVLMEVTPARSHIAPVAIFADRMNRMSQGSDKSKAFSVRRHAPPDYTSRGVKLRIFITLASIMLVAALIERTWTNHKHNAPPPSEPFNNRLNAEPRTTHDPAGTFVAASDARSDIPRAPDKAFDPVERAVNQCWKDIFTRIGGDDRDLLFHLLHSARHHRPLSPENSSLAEM